MTVSFDKGYKEHEAWASLGKEVQENIIKLCKKHVYESDERFKESKLNELDSAIHQALGNRFRDSSKAGTQVLNAMCLMVSQESTGPLVDVAIKYLEKVSIIKTVVYDILRERGFIDKLGSPVNNSRLI